MISEALRQELTEAIPELAGQIYPTNAPKSSTRPYLVYARLNTNLVKTLDGYTGNQGLQYMFSVMATRYEDMTALRYKVETVILSLPGRRIGGNGIYIQEVEINNINESYEFDLNMNRGIIDFAIHF